MYIIRRKRVVAAQMVRTVLKYTPEYYSSTRIHHYGSGGGHGQRRFHCYAETWNVDVGQKYPHIENHA